jgi:DNA polymerase III subunit epsilon
MLNRKYNEVPVVFIDVETTGLHPSKEGVVQIALVRFENGRVVASEKSLINPGVPIGEGAMKVHGITEEMVKGAPSLKDFANQMSVVDICHEATPGAYNAPFDRDYFMFHYDRTLPWVDPMVLTAIMDKNRRRKLTERCEEYEIELLAAHDAMADCVAAGELFYKVMPFLYPANTPQMRDVLRRQEINRIDNWHFRAGPK